MFLEHLISIRMISEGSCDTDESSNEKYSMATTAYLFHILMKWCEGQVW